MGYLIALLAVLASGVCGLYFISIRKNRELKKELSETRERLKRTIDEVSSVVDLHNQQQKIREDAETEKQELEQTNDSDLDDRANNLFK